MGSKRLIADTGYPAWQRCCIRINKSAHPTSTHGSSICKEHQDAVVTFGRTGLKVSRFALGMMPYGTPKWRPWVLDEVVARPLVRSAIEAGINFYDTADMYAGGASEELIGKFVREFCHRDEVVVVTKVRDPVDRRTVARTSRNSSMAICPGAELLLPTANVAAEP